MKNDKQCKIVVSLYNAEKKTIPFLTIRISDKK